MKYLFIIITTVFITSKAYSQKSLSEIIKDNTSTFKYQNNQFEGKGWEEVLNESIMHKSVLIGEDHFFNEIPLFISEITSQVKFDNFFCEIDPYSAEIIEQKIHTLTEEELSQYLNELSNNFSFYGLAPEFNLLKSLALEKTRIIGTDQIVLIADELMATRLLEITTNSDAKKIYTDIKNSSVQHLDLFVSGKGEPYFFTEAFEKNLRTLDSLNLSPEEHLIIKNLKLSKKIYTTGNHHLRIQLMKNNMLNAIESIKNEKNLFKYGAIHINKGESILGGYDIGNLVHNITDANFDSSVHIMIIGKNGMQGIPLKGMGVPQKLDPNSNDLKHYSDFYNNTEGTDWHLFNTKQILKEVKNNNVNIENKVLLKTLKGFDYLIVIPEVTAATFLK